VWEEPKEGKKKKKKNAAEEEEKKEDKLEVPDNSMSYQEYKEQKKKLTEGKREEKKEQQKSLIPQVDLKPKTKTTEDEIGISSNKPTDKKQPAKPKEKKVDSVEESLNKIVGQKIVEKQEEREYQPRTYDKKGKYGGKKENQGQGFTFSKDAFPELK